MATKTTKKAKGKGLDRTVLPPPPLKFGGKIGRTADVSKPAWPVPNRANE